MSTPPPPSQPPSGGFGAPQDPPPVGFGKPEDQPPGGFGGPPAVPPAMPAGPPPPPPSQPPTVPSAPPAAPPAGPPSGQPAYGYPPQQPQQQPYGYPQQPQPVTTPMYAAQSPAVPAGGGGGGNEVRTQLMIVGAALLAIVLIVGGGLWYVSGEDEGSAEQPVAEGSASPGTGGDKAPGGGGTEKVPAKTKSKTLVNLPMPESAEIVQIPGSWLTDTTYAKSDMGKVVGYNLTDGSKKWEVPLGANVCGASRWVSDNKTAILFDEALPTPEKKYQPCNQVGVIDLEAGKLLWKANAKSQTGGDKPIQLSEVTVSGQTVAAGSLSGGAAWNLADGKVLWSAKTDADRCEDLGYAGGPALAVIRRCGASPNYSLSAQSLDPVTGAQKSSYKLPAGLEFAQIVSSKPLVVAVDVNNTSKNATGVSDLFVLDDGGQLKTRIPLTSGNYNPECGATEVEDCTHMVVGNGKLYLPTVEHKGTSESGRTNEIVSFDLETGKLTADRADAGERTTVFPMRMDGSNLIAYKVPPYDGGGQVVSIDGKTMKQTVLMQNPATKESQRAETQYVPNAAEYRYGNGRLFIARNAVHSKSSVNTDPYYTFVSFTTG
ncbi:PQQ-binding-like beta-propeller repeat protein [Streptomyces sp. TBY4]|uniref:outer membrane protein assembly factor BamB family protein n=1 Tax=Streptomyces sp. TBY4 TaxID=2962030 RepID=UPI0020B7B839|nr:PQQ-binding-like beta-propeller repeat protein [Streptomyces sp. TBY4]MCP3758714.1 PQQ-binding-like beta-propeller repeat protein [Streptomyces sp. TBY4]